MPDTVIVTDMLKCFMEKGHTLYVGDHARDIIPNVQKLLEGELARGAKVFFISDHHDPDDLEFKMFPRHCVVGTPEAEVIPELAKYPGQVIPKKRYSGFFNTDLEARLRDLRSEKLVICGVLTDICVLHTTADARNRDYAVEVPVDCVATTDEKTQQFALNHIEKVLGAKLTRSGDYR
jgi:nicotinamidase/pyrazinamidase